MKLLPFTFLFLISFFNANAQKAEMIKGKWVFKDIVDKEKLDSLSLKTAMVSIGNMQIELAADGQYIYGQTAMGTWTLNKEETKVVVVTPEKTIGSMTYPAKTKEMPVISVSKEELIIGMGLINVVMVRPAPAPQAPAKALKLSDETLAKCGTPAPEDVLIHLVSLVKSKNLSLIMNASCGLGITGFKLSGVTKTAMNQGREEECIAYYSNENVFGGSLGLRIYQFKNGDLDIYCSLNESVHEALYKKCNGGALQYIESDNLWDYYVNGTNELMGVIKFPNGTNPVLDPEYKKRGQFFGGGSCYIYNYSIK